MQPGRIGITALITLLAAATTTFIPNFPGSLSASPALAQTAANGKAEADRLREQGNEQLDAGQFQAAIQSYQQALAVYREIGDRGGEANALQNLGYAYINLGQYTQATESYQQHLAVVREIGNRGGEANSLYGLGWAYNFQGQYQQAIKFFEQTLVIAREINNRSGEADSLHALGWAYDDLGQRQQAIEFYQQALTIARDINDRRREANVLNGLGWVHNFLGEYQQAIDFFDQQLTVAKETGDRRQEANSLNGQGWSYRALGQYQRAIEFSTAALAIQREIADHREEAYSLGDLGVAYSALEQYPQAIVFLQQALAIQQQLGNRWGEGTTLSDIGDLLAKQNQPELAIVFYKQSVNVTEAIRRDLEGLPQEQQQSFTQTVADTYRTLADLLLKQDRVLEAQRVLDLLKVQELEDYLRNVRGNEQTTQGVPNSPQEQQIQSGYQAILDKAIQLGRELSRLESIPATDRTPAQQQRIVELRKNEQEISQQFQEFLKSPEVTALVAQLRQTTLGEGFDLDKYATSLQDNLKRVQQEAVILYPFVLDDRLELVLVTAYAPPIRRTIAVKREDLNRAIVEFRSALKTPSTNAKTPAHKLYNWLIKPIENDLAEAKAKIIIYAPDGQLRYIPLAALYDSNQWLVQRFDINNITAISLTDFNTRPIGEGLAPLQVFAGAFTKGTYSFEVGGQAFTFSGLPFAGREVENLAKTIPNTTKVLDNQFNPDTVYSMNDYSVVHLATHGAFIVGQPEDSFIMFGNGKYATLRDMGKWRLPNVDLMVLSACETALGDELGNGNEILGLGYQMQQTGARAVIASLWSVNDGGTQALMDAFYAALENGNTTKAEALRQAQIALITDNYTALGQQRGLEVQQSISSSLPLEVNSRLSHPYYWAPFILIGNGL